MYNRLRSRFHLDSLRTRVLLLVLLIFLPLVILIGVNYQEQRSYAAETGQEEALLVTQILAAQHSQQIESSRQLLVSLAQLPTVREQDIEACNTLFADLMKHYEGRYLNIALVNLEGETICSAVPEALGFNYAEDQWFKDLLVTHQMTFGTYRIGRVSGQPVLPVNYPILDESGQLLGIVSAVLAVQWLNSFVETSDIPPLTHVTIVDQNNIVLARYPDPEAWLGKVYPNEKLVSEMRKKGRAGSIRTAGIDDRVRFFGFAPLQPEASDAYITVGFAEEVVFADAEAVLNRSLLALFSVTAILFAGAWFGSSMMVRPVHRLIEASHNLARGDLTTRVETETGVAELNELAATFNEMADSVERRVAERTAELKEINEKLQQEIQRRKRIERELRRNEIRLRESNAGLENFAYIASHDLQEPLRKVQTFGSRLQSKYGDILGEEGRDYLHRMQTAITRMQQLIRDLLSYSRITSHHKPFSLVDMNEVIQEVQTDLESQIERTGGKIEVQRLPALEAERTQMRQLFQNLLNNALKYHRPGVPPEIKIYATQISTDNPFASTVEKINSYQIYIQDNGIGFEEKFSERIFGLFERLHGRSEYEGTGIGLAICRRIVERHNGTIMAASEPGKGSTFIVTLPVRQAEGESIT